MSHPYTKSWTCSLCTPVLVHTHLRCCCEGVDGSCHSISIRNEARSCLSGAATVRDDDGPTFRVALLVAIGSFHVVAEGVQFVCEYLVHLCRLQESLSGSVDCRRRGRVSRRVGTGEMCRTFLRDFEGHPCLRIACGGILLIGVVGAKEIPAGRKRVEGRAPGQWQISDEGVLLAGVHPNMEVLFSFFLAFSYAWMALRSCASKAAPSISRELVRPVCT